MRRLYTMSKRVIHCLTLSLGVLIAVAQPDRKVQNRPYTDLRPFHFGVLLGTHMQDIELNNVGLQRIPSEDGSMTEALITAEQNRWDAGLTVGVLGEFRIDTYFQFRIAPAMYFGNRHLTYRNLHDQDKTGRPLEQRQDMKTAYISTAFDLIFAAPRFNNRRPYLMVGLTPMINLSKQGDQLIALKRHDTFAEIGIGCDIYLQYFKLRPELKFMYGLTNSYDAKHASTVKDKNMLPYTHSVDRAQSKMIVLSFYFE